MGSILVKINRAINFYTFTKMTELQYTGEWEFDLKLDKIAELNSDLFFDLEFYETLKQKLKHGLVPVVVVNEKSAESPSSEQMNCIHWIVKNQEDIWMALYASIKEKIFPFYHELWQDAHETENGYFYPELNAPLDLKKVLGIEQIEVFTESREGLSYYRLFFRFSADPEHGLILTMHTERLLAFCGMGDCDHKGIIEDMGLDYGHWLEEHMAKMNNGN